MEQSAYQAIYELTRGNTVESIHYGSLAIVNVQGDLLYSYGNPYTLTYLRSTAKPFQALPFIEERGHEKYDLTLREVALICASHSGTDEHVAVVHSIQAKTGVRESDLMCGTHPVFHPATAEALRERGEQPTPNRHNCSGKHTGMLASARLNQFDSSTYIDFSHPLQQRILRVFAEMCRMPIEQVGLGIDGCSAPNFAAPLYNTALAFARLSDPGAAGDISIARQTACQTITAAMTAHPDMVGGPDSFDTHLMRVANGKIVSKGGAEGYQGIGILPGALGAGSQGMGIALKISDGDPRGRAGRAVVLEVLRQLKVLDAVELAQLEEFGPNLPIYNWRKLVIGQARPVFVLDPHTSLSR